VIGTETSVWRDGGGAKEKDRQGRDFAHPIIIPPHARICRDTLSAARLPGSMGRNGPDFDG
jgi:hypothetical protein